MGFQERLQKLFHAEVSINKKDIKHFRNRFRKEPIILRIRKEQDNINTKLATLRASDPKTSLQRGFSLTYKKDGKLVKSVKDIFDREVLKTEISDGAFVSTVDRIEVKQNGQR